MLSICLLFKCMLACIGYSFFSWVFIYCCILFWFQFGKVVLNPPTIRWVTHKFLNLIFNYGRQFYFRFFIRRRLRETIVVLSKRLWPKQIYFYYYVIRSGVNPEIYLQENWMFVFIKLITVNLGRLSTIISRRPGW